MDTKAIIIKKKSGGGGGGGHHGGAWKVAYADFVTAMMAFFLLMWLLNATSEEQRKGLADYFDPSIPISRNSAGGAGVLGGKELLVPPDATGTRKEGKRAKPTHAEAGKDLGKLRHSPDKAEGKTKPRTGPAKEAPKVPGKAASVSGDAKPPKPGTADERAGAAREARREAEKAARAAEAAELAAIGDDLAKRIKALGEEGLLKHFSMRVTPEGLVIEIGDLTGQPLFTSGSSTPRPVLKDLIEILVPVLAHTTNQIAVVGHTDAAPFAGAAGRSNWDLSADRANAARRIMLTAGLSANRVVRVSGRAATDPIDKDPHAARNRRIAVTLLRRPRS